MKIEEWLKLQNGSDIRGVALEGVAGENVNLTPDVANCIGQAFAIWLSQKRQCPIESLHISVGQDSRISGPALSSSLCQGLLSQHSQVSDFKLASTPAMFMSTLNHSPNFQGAIMITASHLPFNRNGFKFFTQQGGLEKHDITELLKLAAQQSPKPSNQSAKQIDFMSTYAYGLVNKIRQEIVHPIHFERPLTGLKILVDAGNGAGGFYVDKVLKPLGADTTGSQFLEPDGHFPNHIPNPEDATAMQALRNAVLANKADFGIIFDTDVDRSAAVDHQGQELNRNRLIALISAILLKQHPKATIVTDSVTSDGLNHFIEHTLQGKHHRFQRGYKNVINEAIRLNNRGTFTPLAIETSGHAAFKENHFLDDGAYLVTKLLIELAKSKMHQQSLGDLISQLQEPVEELEKRYQLPVANFKTVGQSILNALQNWVGEQADWEMVTPNYEGIRVQSRADNEQGWFLLRLSLHDPVMALNLESNITGGTAQMLKRLEGFLKQFVSV